MTLQMFASTDMTRLMVTRIHPNRQRSSALSRQAVNLKRSGLVDEHGQDKAVSGKYTDSEDISALACSKCMLNVQIVK